MSQEWNPPVEIGRSATIPTSWTTATEKFLWDEIEKLKARITELESKLESERIGETMNQILVPWRK